MERMETEIAAVLTVAAKLEVLEKLLDKRMMRAATDTVSPSLPLLEKVYRLGEYKRLCANLAVMEHRIRCALGDGECDEIVRAAKGLCGARLSSRHSRALCKKAQRVLLALRVTNADLQSYKTLPLFRAECARIQRRQSKAVYGEKKGVTSVYCETHWHDAASAYCPDGRIIQA